MSFRPFVTSSAVSALLFSSLLCPARADVYHAVAAGETLSQIAAKYGVTTDQLRATNHLKDQNADAPLGAMLLRVPGADEQKFGASALQNLDAAPSAPATFGTSSVSPATAVGTLGKSVVETIRVGDTWETIADRYQKAGHDVSAQSLQIKNGIDVLPNPGSTIFVPLGQIEFGKPALAPRIAPETPTFPRATMRASAQTSTQNSTQAAPRLVDGAFVSGELDLPLATATASRTPIYQAPNAPKPIVRGNLSGRGGFDQLGRTALGGEVRVLGAGEEVSAPPAPRSRLSASTSPSLARVAQVASNGAKIRRLPQASAVTLYRCAVGTQLAVLKKNGEWSAVLMSDRSTGWVPSKYLRETTQSVDVSSQVVTSGSPGGAVANYRGYNGENPFVANALTWLGTPYHYGGTSRRGIDCSSLVQHAFAANGYNLPRTAAQQSTVGNAVDPANLSSGDRLYFSASGTRIDHTGLYMGNGLFVHASGSGRQVMVSNLFEPRNWNIFVGARR